MLKIKGKKIFPILHRNFVLICCKPVTVFSIFSGEEHHVEPPALEKKGEEKLTHESHSGHSHEGHSHRLVDDHALIGITLVSGFIFMLLVDQIGGGGHMHAPSGMGKLYRAVPL